MLLLSEDNIIDIIETFSRHNVTFTSIIMLCKNSEAKLLQIYFNKFAVDIIKMEFFIVTLINLNERSQTSFLTFEENKNRVIDA